MPDPGVIRIRAKARGRRDTREPCREGIGLRLPRRHVGYMPYEISRVPLQFADAHLDQGNRPATDPHHIFVLIGGA